MMIIFIFEFLGDQESQKRRQAEHPNYYNRFLYYKNSIKKERKIGKLLIAINYTLNEISNADCHKVFPNQK